MLGTYVKIDRVDVLSKRWNPLWLSVLDLNFDAQTFDTQSLYHAANKIIPPQRGIEELDIDMLENVNGLTDSIFSCKTLTVLKLKNLSMRDDNCQIDLPLQIFVSQLRICLFTGCRGRKCELQFAEYVMQNSKP
ncbi:FBD protein [Medicago truncatula]|uniref:FBD protein n=1 Tax=Medicago truncatula TaxID=3880 RepID=G7IMF7_MEDTR|nr:FBD protein [Medicago truncatula]